MNFSNCLFSLYVLITGIVMGAQSECHMDDDHCEFWLDISIKMTMMYKRDAVYPYKGKLYKYDVPEAETNVTEPIDPDDVIVSDGWETQRLVIVANGTMPGPPIEVYEGQTVVVHVNNQLTSGALTIHWHGLHQRDTPWMDGVALVTQCPVDPGQTFTYHFKAYPKGTFWYHAHLGTQLGMGLLGAFIIREKKPLEMQEHIMMLQDWNHDTDAELVHYGMLYGTFIDRKEVVTTSSLEGGRFSRFVFQSGLINGRGRYFGGTNSSNQPPLTEYLVQQGQAYRFRVVGAGTLYPFRVSVDEHLLTLVASDGYELQPVEIESFVIQPGERYDFVLHANQSVDRYWIRAETLEMNVVNHVALAVLKYQGSGSEGDPITERKRCMPNDRCVVANCPFSYYPEEQYTDCLNLDQLKARESYETPGASTGADGEIEDVFLNFAFPGISWYPGSVNGRSLRLPASPALTQPAEFSTKCGEEHGCGEQKQCACSMSLTLEHNKSYQMILMNMGNGKGWPHPIHMHGHSFHLVKMGYPPYNTTTGILTGDNLDIDCGGNVTNPKDSFCNQASWANRSWGGNSVPGLELEAPPRKDTVIVPTGGYVVVRIKADNPGVWFMHCHIELHAQDGMALMLNESFAHHKSPPPGFPKCGHFHFREEGALSNTGLKDTKDTDEDCNELEDVYWAVIGCLAAIILIQLVIIMCLQRRSGSASSGGPTEPEASPQGKAAYSNQAFTISQ